MQSDQVYTLLKLFFILTIALNLKLYLNMFLKDYHNKRTMVKSAEQIHLMETNSSDIFLRNKINISSKVNLPAVYISTKAEMFSYMEERQWPLIITMSLGRLGNNIHNYALCLVLQQIFPNATYAVTEKLANFVAKILDPNSLTLPVINYERIYPDIPQNFTRNARPNPDEHISFLLPAIKSVMGKRIVLVLEDYFLDIFAGYENYLFHSLQIRSDLRHKAAEFLTKIKASFNKNQTDQIFIGVHIRRADYIPFATYYLETPSLPGKMFYNKAFRFYKKKFKNPIFIVCSDDLNYVRRAFSAQKDVVISVNRTAEEDLALLASCSHSIMTDGSFGFWGSFLTGGRVIYSCLRVFKRNPYMHPNTLGNAFQNFIGMTKS